MSATDRSPSLVSGVDVRFWEKRSFYVLSVFSAGPQAGSETHPFLREFAVELDLVPSSAQTHLKTAQSRDSVVDLFVYTAGSSEILSL